MSTFLQGSWESSLWSAHVPSEPGTTGMGTRPAECDCRHAVWLAGPTSGQTMIRYVHHHFIFMFSMCYIYSSEYIEFSSLSLQVSSVVRKKLYNMY